jgi:heme-degrading monooxygenase HmoA
VLELLARTERLGRWQPGARRCAFAARLDAPDEGVLVREWDSHDAIASYHRSEPFAC